MRIEFRYNFGEWLEWRRASIHSTHLNILQTAEALLMPLYFLCGLSIICSLLPLFNPGTRLSEYVPGWLPIPILILIAVLHVYLARNPGLRRKAVKKEWQEALANRNYQLDFTDVGFDYTSGTSTRAIPWDEIASVFQTRQLIILRESNDEVFLVPKRAFASSEQLDELLELAHRKTVSDRE